LLAGTIQRIFEELYTVKPEKDSISPRVFFITYSRLTTAKYLVKSFREKLHSATERTVTLLEIWLETSVQEFQRDGEMRLNFAELVAELPENLRKTLHEQMAETFRGHEYSELQKSPLQRSRGFLNGTLKKGTGQSAIGTLKGGAGLGGTWREKVSRSFKGEKEKSWVFAGVLDFSSRGISRAIALLEHRLFSGISLSEFVRCEWGGETGKDLAPGLTGYIKRVNRMIYWVGSEVVFAGDAKSRSEIIKKFIDVAIDSIQICNFNTAMEIFAGLHLAAIQRLKQTWKVHLFYLLF
jgi:hypothetical protein